MGKKKVVEVINNALVNSGIDWAALVNGKADGNGKAMFDAFQITVNRKYSAAVIANAAKAAKANAKASRATRVKEADAQKEEALAIGLHPVDVIDTYEKAIADIDADIAAEEKAITDAANAAKAALPKFDFRKTEAYQNAIAILATFPDNARMTNCFAKVSKEWFKAWGIELSDSAAFAVGGKLYHVDMRETSDGEFFQSGGNVIMTCERDSKIMNTLILLTADTLLRASAIWTEKVVYTYDSEEQAIVKVENAVQVA